MSDKPVNPRDVPLPVKLFAAIQLVTGLDVSSEERMTDTLVGFEYGINVATRHPEWARAVVQQLMEARGASNETAITREEMNEEIDLIVAIASVESKDWRDDHDLQD